MNTKRLRLIFNEEQARKVAIESIILGLDKVDAIDTYIKATYPLYGQSRSLRKVAKAYLDILSLAHHANKKAEEK